MDTYHLESDAVSLVLTRPLTQFGVPFVAFYSNGVLCFLAWTVLQAIFQQTLWLTVFFLAVFILSHIAMAWMVFRDPFGLSIFWINATRFKKHSTYSFWNHTDSYSP
jgi:type IV secretory pathway VirB3-like protein